MDHSLHHAVVLGVLLDRCLDGYGVHVVVDRAVALVVDGVAMLVGAEVQVRHDGWVGAVGHIDHTVDGEGPGDLVADSTEPLAGDLGGFVLGQTGQGILGCCG